jgi:hypothetical protein
METRKSEGTTSTPSVRFVLDRQGRGWFCNGQVVLQGDLPAQGCVRAEEWIYDRNFGG